MSDQPHHHSPEVHPEAASPTPAEPATVRAGAQDELSTLIQRLKDEPASQIRLVLPERSIAGQGSVGLKLIADEAEAMGKQVEIASESIQVQSLARRAGLVLVAGAGTAVVHGFLPGQDAAAAGFTPGVIGPVEPPMPTTPEPLTTPSQAKLPVWKRIHLGKVAIGLVVVVLIIGAIAAYLATTYLPNATIVVYTKERTLDRDLTVTADPTVTKADVKSLTVPADTVTADVTKTETYQATGKKDIGEKAKGTITLANYTSTDKTFAAGTKISSSKYDFVTNAVVTVPAQSIDLTKFPNVTTPGTIDVAVTAAALGEEYNLAAKTNFTVASTSATVVSGQNAAAFTGGTKQSVTVISADDRKEASDSLTESAKDEAEKSLKAKVETGQLLIEEAMTVKTTSTNFSGAVGDQVSSFTGTIKVTASAPVVSEDDLKSMLNTAVAEKVPDGYTMDDSQSTVDNHVLKVDTDGSVELTSTLKTLILPQVDVDAMRLAVKGKKPEAVQEYLKSQPNLSGYDIKLSPKLPAPFNNLPKIDSHIQIKVEVQK